MTITKEMLYWSVNFEGLCQSKLTLDSQTRVGAARTRETACLATHGPIG